MFNRYQLAELQRALKRSPAVVLLGPRQVGKTTLAFQVAQADGVYLDLESPEDRNKLSNVEQYLRGRQDKLVVLDEVQRLPTLFEPLRGLIDQAPETIAVADGTLVREVERLLAAPDLPQLDEVAVDHQAAGEERAGHGQRGGRRGPHVAPHVGVHPEIGRAHV